MGWSEVFHRGARRLADPTTYLILAVTTALAILPIALLAWVNSDSSAGELGVLLFSIPWGWLVAVYLWGALFTAASERHGPGTGAVLRATFTRFGDFLGVALLLLGVVIVVVLALGVLGLLGLGGTSAAPFVALLSPVFFVTGGVGLVALLAVARLAFAAVGTGGARAGQAVRQAWDIAKVRRSDLLLWLVADTALVTAGVLVLAALVALGAALAGLIPLGFLTAGTGSELFEDQFDEDAGALAFAIFTFVVLAFAAMLAGTATAFSAGTATGFYSRIRRGEEEQVRAPEERGFCDQCGALRTASSPFCDSCGAAVPVG